MSALTRMLKESMFYKKLYFWKQYVLPEFLYGQKNLIKKRFKKYFGWELDLNNPQTMNEKIQWLKIYDKKDFHTLCADKYRVRKYLKENFGEEYLIPLLFYTSKYKDINPQNVTFFPCVVKSNTGCGWYKILWDKEAVDWKGLQEECKEWMSRNFYYYSWEWQYKNIKSCLMVEKLLLNGQGKVPNDYKLHFLNGKLEFVYCSIDRFGANYRRMYTPLNWERIDFEWPEKPKLAGEMPDIEKPVTFEKMLEIGSKIAKNFKYVRVDFYDLDGVLYFGEITLHQSSGFGHFKPEEYDLYYGQKLDLNENKIDVTVVVRSVGERTEAKCVEYLENIFGKENVFHVKNVIPFSKAVRKTFEIGLQHNKKWTLAVDADVFLFPDKIAKFIEAANDFAHDKNVFCLEGKLFDKLSQIYRDVGCHLYQTKNLQKALEFVDAGIDDVRPEYYVKVKMSELGINFYRTDLQIGIHDFFQSPESIAKKVLLHCKKHDISSWIKKWEELAKTDEDFIWALKGVEIFYSLADKTIKVDAAYMDTLIKSTQFHKSKTLTDDVEIQEKIEQYNTYSVHKRFDLLLGWETKDNGPVVNESVHNNSLIRHPKKNKLLCWIKKLSYKLIYSITKNDKYRIKYLRYKLLLQQTKQLQER